jgi:uncharacterized protein involved in exopolysaccharide biosynthesis
MADKIEIQQETTLRDFLNVMFRRKWIIISVVAFATVMVFYLNTRQPAFWESSSRTLVQRGEQSNILTGAIRYLSWEEEVSSQIEVILSESVFSRANEIFLDSLAARGLPEQWRFYSGLVRADVVGESNVFAIRCLDLNPQIAEMGCQAMTMSFQEYYRERKAPPALADFFAEEMSDVRTDLEHWEKKRNEFLNEEKFFGMYEESRHLLGQIATLENALTETDANISVQAARVKNLAELIKRSGSELEDELAIRLSGNFVQQGLVQQIKFKLQALNQDREELLQKFTEKHPEIVAIDSQRADLHGALKREINNAYNIEVQELEGLQARRASIGAQLDIARSDLNSLPDKDLELTKFDNVIANLRAKYELLLERQSMTDIALAGRPEWEVTVLSSASPPYSKKTHDYVRLALGPILSIVVALGLAFFLESLDHSVKNMAEAEEYLNTAVLTTISEVRK